MFLFNCSSPGTCNRKTCIISKSWSCNPHCNPISAEANQNFYINLTLELHNDLDVSHQYLHNKFNYSIIFRYYIDLRGCQATIPGAMTPKSAAPLQPAVHPMSRVKPPQVMLNHSKKTMAQVLYPYPGATIPTYLLYKHMLLKSVKIHRLSVCQSGSLRSYLLCVFSSVSTH